MRLKNYVRHITVIVIFCELSAMHFFLIVTKSHSFKNELLFHSKRFLWKNKFNKKVKNVGLEYNAHQIFSFWKTREKSVALLSPPGRLQWKHRFLNHLIFSLLFSPFALVWRVGKNRRFQIKSDKSLLTIPL